MKAALYNGEKKKPEIVEMKMQDIGEDDILLKSILVDICGSELLIYRLTEPGSFVH